VAVAGFSRGSFFCLNLRFVRSRSLVLFFERPSSVQYHELAVLALQVWVLRLYLAGVPAESS